MRAATFHSTKRARAGALPAFFKSVANEHSPASRRATRLIYHEGEEVREGCKRTSKVRKYLRKHTPHAYQHTSENMRYSPQLFNFQSPVVP